MENLEAGTVQSDTGEIEHNPGIHQEPTLSITSVARVRSWLNCHDSGDIRNNRQILGNHYLRTFVVCARGNPARSAWQRSDNTGGNRLILQVRSTQTSDRSGSINPRCCTSFAGGAHETCFYGDIAIVVRIRQCEQIRIPGWIDRNIQRYVAATIGVRQQRPSVVRERKLCAFIYPSTCVGYGIVGNRSNCRAAEIARMTQRINGVAIDQQSGY